MGLFSSREVIYPSEFEMSENMIKTRNFFYQKCFVDIIGEACSHYMLVAGGSVLDYFMNKKITSDFDIYFETHDAREFYLEKIQEDDHEIITETSNAILIKRGDGYLYHLINPEFIPSTNIFDFFDFNVCCVGVDNKKHFLYEETALYSIYDKNLIILNVIDPLSTLKRLQKYIKKGFEIKNDHVFFEFIDVLHLYYNSAEYKAKRMIKY